MTIQECYDSVAQLGFETSLEDNDRFYFAVNRSIKQVGRIRPAVSIYKLSHFPLANIVEEDTENPVEGNCSFAGTGVKSYYFEANGNGIAYIEKKNSDGTFFTLKTISLSSANGVFVAYKGFVLDGAVPYLGEIRISFTGEYIYYVRNVAFYQKKTTDNVSEIPSFGKYARYNLNSLVSDFLSFSNPPIMDTGFIYGRDYYIEGQDTILLPMSISGVFDVKYERMRRDIDNSGTNSVLAEKIDLDEELAALLPLLVAGYIWADDEPAKAEYYMNLYREQENNLVLKNKNYTVAKCVNKYGW